MASLDLIELPSDKIALCRLLTRHAFREEERLRYRRMMWLLAWLYLNGSRRFDVVDPATGTVHALYTDTEGNLEFQSQELLSLINRTAARLASMDFRPRVQEAGGSLAGIRDRSTGQIVMDSVVQDDPLTEAKRDFAFLYTCLGSAGITGHLVDHPTVGLVADMEVIHPRELFPFPSLGQDYTKASGLMRYRALPLATLEDRFGAKKVAANLTSMDYWETLVGEDYSERTNTNVNNTPSRMYGPTTSTTVDQEEIHKIARIKEVWLSGKGGTCSRYVLTCGDVVLVDEDYSRKEIYCPIGFRRFYETGSFHGAGLFDVMFPIARQMELNIRQLFQNIRDTDQYGILVIPSGQFNERSVLKDVGRGLRALPWEPDPITEGFKPFAIQPFNSGEAPGKVAQFARSLLQGLDPSPDISDQKGRVDSASGLAFLEEQATKALTFPAQGIERAFSTAYRAIAGQAVESLAKSPRPLPVGRLTLDLAGAVIDPETHTVSFKQNPIPDLSRLSFSIRDMNPKSEAARKAEALALTEKGIQDRDALILYCIQSGVELAAWTEEEKSAYESVVRNILILYGDGVESAGQVIITPETVKPLFQLRVLSAFMGSVKMSNASPEVVEQFQKYREFLLMQVQGVLPNAAPNPDDVAMMSQAQGAPGPQQPAKTGKGS